MFFSKKSHTKKNEKFSVSFLAGVHADNFLEINNWFLKNIKSINLLYNSFQLELNDIDVNFGKSQYSSIENFLRRANQNKLDIAFFLAQTKGMDEILMLYDNPYINQNVMDNCSAHEAKFIMMCPYEYKDRLLDFVIKDVDLKIWSYIYGMSLSGDQTLDGSRIKSNIFSNTNIPLDSEKEWNNLLLKDKFLSEHGLIKDIYEFNVLNSIQAKKINLNDLKDSGIGNVFIQDEKYFWLLNSSEVDSARSKIKTSGAILALR